MGRRGAMASAADDPEPAKPVARANHDRADSQRHVVAQFHHDVNEDRYRALAGLTIRGVDPRYLVPALESAKRLWCRLGDFALSTLSLIHI